MRAAKTPQDQERELYDRSHPDECVDCSADVTMNLLVPEDVYARIETEAARLGLTFDEVAFLVLRHALGVTTTTASTDD